MAGALDCTRVVRCWWTCKTPHTEISTTRASAPDCLAPEPPSFLVRDGRLSSCGVSTAVRVADEGRGAIGANGRSHQTSPLGTPACESAASDQRWIRHFSARKLFSTTVVHTVSSPRTLSPLSLGRVLLLRDSTPKAESFDSFESFCHGSLPRVLHIPTLRPNLTHREQISAPGLDKGPSYRQLPCRIRSGLPHPVHLHPPLPAPS